MTKNKQTQKSKNKKQNKKQLNNKNTKSMKMDHSFIGYRKALLSVKALSNKVMRRHYGYTQQHRTGHF